MQASTMAHSRLTKAFQALVKSDLVGVFLLVMDRIGTDGPSGV